MSDSTEPKTELEKLIEAERKKAADKIAKLKRDAQAEQRKADLKVVELLKAKHPDAYEQFVGEARASLASERAERSRKAKRALAPEARAEDDGYHGSEEHHG